MSPLKQKYVEAFFFLFAVTYFILAIVGAVRAYSPVPYWDMWDSYLPFYIDTSHSDLDKWWGQHNEHRIVLARVFFWLDLSLFKGAGVFLVIVNYILATSSFYLFWNILKEVLPADGERFPRNVIGFTIFILCFSWIQRENLTWGFQSQFFLAQLLPLFAFYLLHRAHIAQHYSAHLFIASCLAGLLAIGSMANGVLTLPLMFLLSLVLKMGRMRSAILLVSAIFSCFIYFYHYVAPAAHGSMTDAVFHHPMELVQFMSLYLGGPIHHVPGMKAKAASEIAGLILVVGTTLFAARSPIKPVGYSLQLSLLTFILYIVGTAFGTACGRLNFGLEGAFAGRYATPATMAWIALLILYSPGIAKIFANSSPRILVPFFLIPLLLFPEQVKTITAQNGELFERSVAALALALDINDDMQIRAIFPESARPLRVARSAVEKNVSIFAMYPFNDAIKTFGRSDKSRDSASCIGSLDVLEEIESDPRYFRIRGWLLDGESKMRPEAIRVLDKTGVVVGYAVTGQPRPDTAAMNPKTERAGFVGYLRAGQVGNPIVLHGIGPNCELPVAVHQSSFELKKIVFGEAMHVARREAIIGSNEWTGRDFQKSEADGFEVFGSFIQSDQDTGSVSLKLTRGDSIYYRSGPTGGKQLLVVGAERSFDQILPVATDWVVLEFSNPKLPDQFTVRLIDSGSGWGEWSAIALRK